MASGEDDLIARYFAPIAGPAALGLKDDAALLGVPVGQQLVLTKDALVAGVHFFPDDPPGSVAVKALGVNLSDLAAKAAQPLGFLLALALPADVAAEWLARFAQALGEAAALHGCPLLGGDTVAIYGPVTLSITALGTVAQGRMLPRTGARAGDRIYVSGTIGDGALGLAVRAAERAGSGADWIERLPVAQRLMLRDRYWHPQPRLALRPALACAHAGMDVSDGLAGDVFKLLRVSGVTGRIDAARVPLSPAAATAIGHDPTLLETVLTGGDDYEVLATVPPAEVTSFEAEAARAGVPVTAIGEVLPGDAPPLLLGLDGAPLAFRRPSFSHA